MASEQPAQSGGALADRVSKPSAPAAVEESTTTHSPGQQDGAPVERGGSELLNEPGDYTVEVKLTDLQADPNNPLYSAKSFEQLNLHPNILKGILALNFRKPSKIQERALPLLLANPPTNMIGQSQSGTGKTAAFVLNILHRLQLETEQQRKTPQALVLAPTRELARQIVDVVSLMGRFIEGLVVEAEVPAEERRKGPVQASVIVGTPGTVVDHLRKRLIDSRNIGVLVLDEADNMVDAGGHGDQCLRVKSMLPKNAQMVLFSATFPEHVTRYADRFAPNANRISLKTEELTVEGIKQLYVDCDSDEDKYNVLVKLYGLLTIGSSIIFVKTRATAAEIERRMVSEGHTVASLTAGVEGSLRDKVIDEFREGKAKVLVTTNVLARGIDVSTVSMVINYDIPEIWMPQAMEPQGDPQTYLHRIGRTGRFGRVGVSISFVASKPEWKMLMKIQDYLQTTIKRIDTRDWDEVEEIIKKTIKNPRSQATFTQSQ